MVSENARPYSSLSITGALAVAALLAACAAPRMTPAENGLIVGAAALDIAMYLDNRSITPSPATDTLTGLHYGERYRCYYGDSLVARGYFHNREGRILRFSEDTLAYNDTLECRSLVVLDTSRIARVKPGPKPFSATGTVLGIKAELDRRAMIRNFAMGTLCTTLLPVMILSQDYSCYDR